MFSDIELTAKDTMVTFDDIDGPTLVIAGGDNEPTIYVTGTPAELRALADEIRHALRGL